MSFKIFSVSNLSQLDSIPVAVIKHYPLEERDYKPYAQCNLCLDEQSLLLRMWAFEVLPPPGSEMRGVFYLFADQPQTALVVSLRPDGSCAFSLLEDGAERAVNAPQGFVAHPHSGEDLQGVYWGSLIPLPLDWLSSLAGRVTTQAGDAFEGNFFKLCKGPEMVHYGSFFPADFPGAPYQKKSMGKLLVASY